MEAQPCDLGGVNKHADTDGGVWVALCSLGDFFLVVFCGGTWVVLSVA